MIALCLSGCVQHEVTVTRNGETVTAEPAAPVTDVDPCSVLSPETLEETGLGELEAIPIVDEANPGCEWSGYNDYVTPSLTLWVRGASAGNPDDHTVLIDGKAVQVFAMNDQGGRYVAICGDASVTLNYTKGKGPLTPKAALGLAMPDAIEAYRCT